MKMKNPLFAVRDMAKSIAFYHDVLELKVEQDFGTNIVLTGGLSLQTLDSWQQFIAEKSVIRGTGGLRRTCATERLCFLLFFSCLPFMII